MSVNVKPRVQSVDVLRGIIMVIMVLDHVRDFFHIHGVDGSPVDMATTTPFLFFTRWITHFCAPVFIFLSGISAWLAGQKKTQKQQSIFLIKRGLWLIVAEVCIMTLVLTFNPNYTTIFLLVFWSIGFSMVILGCMLWLPLTAIAITGAVIVLGHNVFDLHPVTNDTLWGRLLNFFVTGKLKFIKLTDSHFIIVGYAPIPWTGIMLLGYTAGRLYTSAKFTAEQRKKILLTTGGLITTLFIVLRLINHYGDPVPATPQKTWVFSLLSFFNANKYPPSLDYTCMTLGPAIIVLALMDQIQNRFTAFVTVYGRVPFFYFVVHFFFIHLLLVVVFFASGYGAKDIVDSDSPFYFRPAHFGFDLWVVYSIWAAVVLILYKPCKWFHNYKLTHTYWWLSYL